MTESSPERPVLEPTRFHRMQIVEGGNLRLTPLDAEGLPAGDPVTFEADYVGIETWTPTSSSPEAPVPDTLRPDQISDPTLQAARLVVEYIDDPDNPRNAFVRGRAYGAIEVWTTVLDMADDPDRAVELARTCVEDAEKGASQ